MVSSCPTCQLNNPQGAQRPQLARPIQQHGTYPGEDWQMDFTQMLVSQGYKYLLIMIYTFTGLIESFPTLTEKAEEVVKKNCSMKSFQGLVCSGHYKVTMWRHLLLRSPKWSLSIGHYLLSPLCLEASVFRKSKKSQSILKINGKNDNPEDLPQMKGGFNQ